MNCGFIPNRERERERERKRDYYINNWFFFSILQSLWCKILPRINLSGAHTSKVALPYPLITQWYTNFSGIVQFCFNAFSLQFFLLAALSHSSLEVGHDDTFSTLWTASLQYMFSFIQTCSECKFVFSV